MCYLKSTTPAKNRLLLASRRVATLKFISFENKIFEMGLEAVVRNFFCLKITTYTALSLEIL